MWNQKIEVYIKWSKQCADMVKLMNRPKVSAIFSKLGWWEIQLGWILIEPVSLKKGKIKMKKITNMPIA